MLHLLKTDTNRYDHRQMASCIKAYYIVYIIHTCRIRTGSLNYRDILISLFISWLSYFLNKWELDLTLELWYVTETYR